MVFASSHRLSLSRLLALLTLATLLSACSSSPSRPKIETAVAATTQAEVPERSPVLPAGEVTPNPYLQNQSPVSAEAQQRFTKALAAMQQQKWTEAESLLISLTRDFPKLSGPFVNLGLVYRAKNQPEQAEQAFQQALAANSDNLDAYNQLALVRREAGDFATAEQLYQQALAVWPFDPTSHKNIAILYDLYLGKSELALQHYQAYQQLLAEPDKQVNGWIIDLERRIAADSQ